MAGYHKDYRNSEAGADALFALVTLSNFLIVICNLGELIRWAGDIITWGWNNRTRFIVAVIAYLLANLLLAYLVRLSGLSWRDVPTAMTKMLGEMTLACLGAALFSAVNPGIDANQLIRMLKTLL